MSRIDDLWKEHQSCPDPDEQAQIMTCIRKAPQDCADAPSEPLTLLDRMRAIMEREAEIQPVRVYGGDIVGHLVFPNLKAFQKALAAGRKGLYKGGNYYFAAIHR